MPDESISAISFSILFKLTLPMTDISCSSSKNSRMAVNLSVIFDLELQASSKTSKSCFLTCPFFVSTLRATVWNKRDARISSFVAPSKSARVHIVAGRQARLLVSWLDDRHNRYVLFLSNFERTCRSWERISKLYRRFDVDCVNLMLFAIDCLERYTLVRDNERKIVFDAPISLLLVWSSLCA